MLSGKPNSVAQDPLRILCVDDEPGILSALRRCFRGMADEVHLAGNGPEALEILEKAPGIQVILSDYRMPQMSGVEFLEEARTRWPDIRRILLTGQADQRAIEDAINRAQVHYFVSKPWSEGHIRSVVRSANETFLLIRQNEQLNEQLRDSNLQLEEKVRTRTKQLSAAVEEWVRSVDAMVDPLVILDENHTVRRANKAAARRAGVEVEEIPGSICHEILFGRVSPCDNCDLPLVLTTGQSRVWQCSGESTTYRVSGHRLSTDPDLPPRAVLTYRDIDSEERLNRRLLQTIRMVGLGQLAGGVAHEINNPLAGVLAFTQMMMLDENRDPSDIEQLEQIEAATKRCMRIVEGLLHFSRPTCDSRLEEFSPEEIFMNLDGIVEPLAAEVDFELQLQTEEDLPLIRGNQGEIEQVLVILLTNGVHAVAPAGQIAVVLGKGPLGVRISVDDSGAGVPKEARSKIFDPFFTTKPEGKGTGLGLSIAHRVVEAHGGDLTVGASDSLGGASFIVDLPALLKETDQ